MDEAGRIGRIVEQAGRAGQVDDLLRLHRHRDCAGGIVGVDVIGLRRRVGADRGDDRDQPVVVKVVEQGAAHLGDPTDEAKPRVDWLDLEQPPVLAGDADRDRLQRVDRGDHVAVGLADQHHADDVERGGVGDPQALDPLDFDPGLGHLDIDLRSAAMDQHRADADRVEQQDVLGEAAHPLRIGQRQAADLHDDGLAGEAADVGQRLDQQPGGFVGRDHDVAAFSLM